MGELLHLLQRGGAWAGCGPAQSPPRCTKCNTHLSTVSVPVTVLQYDGPLLCGFNVAIKGVKYRGISQSSSYMYGNDTSKRIRIGAGEVLDEQVGAKLIGMFLFILAV